MAVPSRAVSIGPVLLSPPTAALFARFQWACLAKSLPQGWPTAQECAYNSSLCKHGPPARKSYQRRDCFDGPLQTRQNVSSSSVSCQCAASASSFLRGTGVCVVAGWVGWCSGGMRLGGGGVVVGWDSGGGMLVWDGSEFAACLADLTLIKTEYWDRAGGAGNMSYDW